MTTYDLTFDGYWRDEKRGGIPAQSGVYCVYACVHNRTEDTVSLKKLIYIGESADVRGRVANHEKRPAWLRHLSAGQELAFTFAPIGSGRNRAEAAMIYKHKPPVNTEYVNEFPFDTTTITTGGRNALLQPRFTVNRTGSLARQW